MTIDAPNITPGQRRVDAGLNDYSIAEHRHRFAAWAAGRAASVRGCRFSVEQGKILLAATQLRDVLTDLGNLPRDVDSAHRAWRNEILEAARVQGLEFTHGVAAKLINVYLKAALVCAGLHRDERVQALHPPIDNLLLTTLAQENVGGRRAEWQLARRIQWSKLNSDQYQAVINAVRSTLELGTPLWHIEKHWRGYQ